MQMSWILQQIPVKGITWDSVQCTDQNGVTVRSNTRYIHRVVTPSAARQLNYRLCPHRSIKGSAETALGMWDLRY